MKYNEITQEQREAIIALFRKEDYCDQEFVVKGTAEWYTIVVRQMHHYAKFEHGVSTLRAMTAIANILCCSDGGEVTRWAASGLHYEIEWWFWREDEPNEDHKQERDITEEFTETISEYYRIRARFELGLLTHNELRDYIENLGRWFDSERERREETTK